MALLPRNRLLTTLALLAIAATAGAGPKDADVTVNGVPAKEPAKALPPNISWLASASVDVVGGTAHGESDPARAKGNSYRIDTSATLNEAEFWLTFSDTQTLTFYVFEGADEFGTYSEVYRSSRGVSGTGTDWYSTGPISVPLTAGQHYIVAVSWSGTLIYYYNIGDSQATSFGAFTHGYATGTDPLPGSFDSTENDQAVYHQRLTTNEPTVPTVATTWSRIKKIVD